MPNVFIPIQLLSKLSKEDQILELNSEVKCTLAPSKIHGIGVFALRAIQKGEHCYITPHMIPRFYDIPFGSLSKLLPEIKELVLQRWASVVNGSLFCNPNDDQHLLMFVNHSPDKANYSVVDDTALQDIRAGDEILEDYTVMANWEKVRPLNKNPWLIATNVIKSKSQRSLIDVLLAKFRIKSFARS